MTPDELPDDMEARTPAPEGEASWIEPALVEHLRSLGCVCPKPLVGYRPNAGPRCRLCNVEPASPVVPVGVSVDALAQEIRRVDGRHTLGAGALAEALLPFLAALLPLPIQGGSDEHSSNCGVA